MQIADLERDLAVRSKALEEERERSDKAVALATAIKKEEFGAILEERKRIQKVSHSSSVVRGYICVCVGWDTTA